MTAKRFLCLAMLGAMLQGPAIRGQVPEPGLDYRSSPPSGPSQGAMIVDSNGPSSWIAYRRASCCSDAEQGSIPIGTEFYFRSGPSLPFGSTVFGRELQTGFAIQGGGRALLFDPTMTKAWAFDVSLSNNQNSGGRANIQVPLSILVPSPIAVLPPQRVKFGSNGLPGVTVRDLNRTFFGLGLGREWYLWGTPLSPGRKWRAGLDGGWRYGTARANFNEIKHRTDVIGGAFAAVHTDVEFPCGCCVFQTGFRGEWAYTWSDILQRASDVQDVNLLINFGIRY